MKVVEGRYRLQLNPARSVLFFQLLLVAATFLLILLLPTLQIYKVFPLSAVGLIGASKLQNHFAELPVTLDYRSVTNEWFLDSTKVKLQSEQFITRNLIILYLVTADGAKLTHLVPADSMSPGQHRCLRRLLIACLRANLDEQSHPDRQS